MVVDKDQKMTVMIGVVVPNDSNIREKDKLDRLWIVKAKVVLPPLDAVAPTDPRNNIRFLCLKEFSVKNS